MTAIGALLVLAAVVLAVVIAAGRSSFDWGDDDFGPRDF